MKKRFDIGIIGAGPIGLYAAYLASENGFSVALIDALPEVGGQLTALYPQKFIFDVAGYPQVTASQLIEELKRQVLQSHAATFLNFRVVSLEREQEGNYKIGSEDGRDVVARYVLIAAGAGMISPRKLEVEGADKYLGHGLEYVVSNVEDYRGKRVLVIGGGDTALDWANFLNDIAAEVTLIHRSDRFVAFESSVAKLQKSNSTVYTFCQLKSIHGKGQIERVEIVSAKGGWSKVLMVDRILCCIGFVPKLGFLKESDLEIADGSLKTDRNMLTTMPNVYAIGDISNHPGRIKLISTGFGNVQIAINHIKQVEKEQNADGESALLEDQAD